MKLMIAREDVLSSVYTSHIVRDVKEKLAYVALNFEEEIAAETTYGKPPLFLTYSSSSFSFSSSRDAISHHPSGRVT